MSGLTNRLREFLFAPQSSIWLTILRTGLGLQVFCYGISLHRDWIEVLGRENQGLIRRDLTEAMLSSREPIYSARRMARRCRRPFRFKRARCPLVGVGITNACRTARCRGFVLQD